MKTLNKNTLRKLILETIEEESIGEAKKKEVEQELAQTPLEADVAAKSAVTAPAGIPSSHLELLNAALEAGADPKSDDMRKAGAAMKAEEALKAIQKFIKNLKGEKVTEEE